MDEFRYAHASKERICDSTPYPAILIERFGARRTTELALDHLAAPAAALVSCVKVVSAAS